MDEEAKLALAALIIGLSALILTTSQLLQQIFGSAEGYRRCQSSVVGPWSRRTRLVWRWSQFRLETKFTTPEIVMIDLHHSDDRFPDTKTPSDFDNSKRKIVDLSSRPLPIELQETVDRSESASDFDTFGDHVSWTSFIRQLSRIGSTQTRGGQNIKFAGNSYSAASSHSSVGVIYRERTWDLMPPEIFRPVASSRLGTVIVLALHLGMRWKSMEISNGILRAEGNGHSLISSMVRGFGLVFYYNFNPEFHHLWNGPSSNEVLQQREHSRAFNNHANKLACGIIPCSKLLQTPDIALHGIDAEETALLLSEAMINLGVKREVANLATADRVGKLTQHGSHNILSLPVNDMICVLTPFLPPPGSTDTRFTYPLRTTVPFSAFLFWEMREVLLASLRDHPHRCHPDRPHLQDVYERLSLIEQKYNDDFYCRWSKAISKGTGYELATILEFLKTLREIHEWTTNLFKSIKSRLPFASLVAGHVTLAGQASMATEHLLGGPNAVPRLWVECAKWYVSAEEGKGLSLLYAEIGPKMLKKGGEEADKKLIEDAWWTLVLRGIVWRMSIPDLREQMIVRSSLYYDQTPVYFL